MYSYNSLGLGAISCAAQNCVRHDVSIKTVPKWCVVLLAVDFCDMQLRTNSNTDVGRLYTRALRSIYVYIYIYIFGQTWHAHTCTDIYIYIYTLAVYFCGGCACKEKWANELRRPSERGGVYTRAYANISAMRCRTPHTCQDYANGVWCR